MTMTAREVMTLIAMATSVHPSLQEKDMRPTLEVWRKIIGDIPYDVAQQAVATVIASSKFFPTPAEIREAAALITQPRSLDYMEAWGLITDAIRKYGHYREAEALASLPADVAEMARQFGFRNLCLNEQPEVLRGQFRMAWETRTKRQDELKKLPTEIRTMIEDLTKGMKLLK